mmetsp:Transcript_132687/g.424570  ORF Transcript_132687/g.424570 Transcript_132687/m.424570 type:complete len:288 (+) Transcript_132687:530-1393(+)
MLADHLGQLLGNLLLPLEEHTLQVHEAPATDLRLHRPEEQSEAQPVREVADDEPRCRQDHEAAPTSERVLLNTPTMVCATTMIKDHPRHHLDETQQKTHHCREMLDENELPRTDVQEHFDEQPLVPDQDVNRHLLDVDDLVDVLLQILEDRLEHCSALLHHLGTQLRLHHLRQPAPDLRTMPVGKVFHHSSSCQHQRLLQTLKKVILVDALNYLLDGNQGADHDVACAGGHDVCASRHNALPTQVGIATSNKIHGIETHLDTEPNVPPREDDRDQGNRHVLKQVLPL